MKENVTNEAVEMFEVFDANSLSGIIGMKVLDVRDDIYGDTIFIYLTNTHGVMCELSINENGVIHLSECYARTESEHFELMNEKL